MEKEQEEKELNEVTAEETKAEDIVKEEAANESDTLAGAQGDTSVEDELAEAKDKYLRLYSEFENFRRRTSKERLELIGTATKELMVSLLPVLDDFERAMAVETNDDNALKEGVELIQQKLTTAMEQKGLKKMGVKKGDKFDDEKHEAITQIPAEKKLEGKVVDVIEAGYTLGETVIRFAKVVVGAKQ